MNHRWNFFRAGGVDQVALRGSDVVALGDLDQKLWVALAMPTHDLDIDPATLNLLDRHRDGRIRRPDVLDAVHWVRETWADPDRLLEGGTSLRLAEIASEPVRAAARRVLDELGKQTSDSIELADVLEVARRFAATPQNGDGVITAENAEDPELKRTIDEIMGCAGSVADRSGQPGIDEALMTRFFADVDQVAAWLRDGAADPARRPLGENTDIAADALAAVRDKVQDYFTRCGLSGFDPRATGPLNAQEADFAAVAAHTVSDDAEAVARLPLARIEAGRPLPLSDGINPAWAARLRAFAERTVRPLLGPIQTLSAADFATVIDRFAPFFAWRAAKPVTSVGGLDAARVRALAEGDQRAAVRALIAADRAREDDFAAIASVEKLLRFQRDLGRLLRNFVNFSDFYGKHDGAFQTGTLYIDGRACELCVPVADTAKHAALATLSAAYLLYCDITHNGSKKAIVAAVTNGDADHLYVGRNGVYYDRAGQDWDATITKIVSNPISVREGFWAPYKKLARLIEEQVGKRAAAAEAASEAKLGTAAAAVAHADKAAVAKPAEPPRKVDVGTVAALGVAIGGIGAMVVGILTTFLGLGLWMPIGILVLLLLISGPSMLLAWMKLRQRNLGPILDANGWAINGRARINSAFGAALTDLARLPPGARRSLDDPYADKSRPWRLYTTLVVLIVLAGAWYVGKLDRYLPEVARSTSVLGRHAPAAAQPPEAAPAPQPAPPK